MRITKAQMQRAAERLAEATGKRMAANATDVGGWIVDYNAGYGGAVIHEVVNEAGGVTLPCNRVRVPPAQFVYACEFAENSARIATAADHDQRNDEAAAKWAGQAETTDLDIALGGERWHQRARTFDHQSAVRIAEKDALESDHEEVIIISTAKGHAVGPVDSHTVYYR